MNELKWAVLGTGVIANEMAQALHNMGRTLYGVCNRTNDKAVSFAKKYHVEEVYTSYNEMYEDSSVNVIYITPPPTTPTMNLSVSLCFTANMCLPKNPLPLTAVN